MPEKKKNITNSIFDFVDLSQECDHVDEDDAEADDDHRHVAERGRGKKVRTLGHNLFENVF